MLAMVLEPSVQELQLVQVLLVVLALTTEKVQAVKLSVLAGMLVASMWVMVVRPSDLQGQQLLVQVVLALTMEKAKMKVVYSRD